MFNFGMFFKKLKRATPFIIILTGIIFRVYQFLYNRSLTEGEAALALNIIKRSYQDLIKPLDYVQAAPYGFLLIQKFFLNLFGNSDYSLRIFPLIAGVLSIFLFYMISKRLLTEIEVLLATFIFVINNELIYFSSEVKQYSSDTLFCIFIVLIVINIIQKQRVIRDIILFGFISAILLWFSHPTLFVFFAGVIILIFWSIINKKRDYLVWIFVAIIVWGISFAFNYNLSLKPLSQNEIFLETWQSSFMPLLPKSFLEFKWYVYTFLRIFKNPLGFSIYEILFPVFIFFVGLIVFWKKQSTTLILLLLPIILTLFASGLKKYPFHGRLLLFITPLIILIIARGLNFIRITVAKGSKVLSVCLTILPLLIPSLTAFYHLFNPRAPEELRPVISYVSKNRKGGDLIYLYYASYNSFLYYSEKFGFSSDDYIIGIESRFDWSKYYIDLQRLKGNPRVWVLFSHIMKTMGVDEERLFVTYLNMLGEKIDEFRASGASAYLYDMSDKKNK